VTAADRAASGGMSSRRVFSYSFVFAACPPVSLIENNSALGFLIIHLEFVALVTVFRLSDMTVAMEAVWLASSFLRVDPEAALIRARVQRSHWNQTNKAKIKADEPRKSVRRFKFKSKGQKEEEEKKKKKNAPRR
jgi:hypothetical protein